MKTYWDLSECERAALSSEDVERFLDAELMTKGVLKAPKFEPVEEPDAPHIPERSFYLVSGFSSRFDVAFATEADAKAFLALKPLHVETRYLSGNYSRSIQVVCAPKETAIECRDLPHAIDVETYKADFEKAAAARAENEKRREEYAQAVKVQNDVLSGLWEDWHRCRGLDARMRQTVQTFNDYTRVALGDGAVAIGGAESDDLKAARVTAARFLLKVFSREQIADAAVWCGIEIQLPSNSALLDAQPLPARSESADVPMDF